jgi:hypothetical protein
MNTYLNVPNLTHLKGVKMGWRIKPPPYPEIAKFTPLL